MAETSITKVNAKSSPKGSMGQKYLAAGVSMAMRLWERPIHRHSFMLEMRRIANRLIRFSKLY